MFSTKERLEKRTPKGGINREDYINLLAGEFYESSSAEAREQVSANLANFSYDPINFDFLKKSNVLEIFLHVLVSGNERLILHGIVGICNFCLDEEIKQNIIQSEGIELISQLLVHKNTEIVLNALTALIFLYADDTEKKICDSENIRTIKELTKSENKRIQNLSKLFLEDYNKNGS